MQQPDRPLKINIARTDEQHFTFHAAQIRQSITRRQPACINDNIRIELRILHICAEAKRYPLFFQVFRKFRQRFAWIKMAFAREEKTLPKSSCKIWLYRINAILIDNLERSGTAR